MNVHGASERKRTGSRAIILAGGKGTRLAPYTTVYPKPMLPLGEKPILELIIKQLSHHGFKDISLSVGYLSELIQAYFENSDKLPEGVKLTYKKEREPLGTAGAISLFPDLDETFLVMNGDVLTTLDFGELTRYHKEKGGMLTIATHKRKVDIDYGVISIDRSGRLTGYDEKPTLDYLVSMGIYVFEPEVLQYIEPNKKLDFPDLVIRLLDHGEKVQGYKYNGYWVDIGRHDDYEMAAKQFSRLKGKLLKKK